MTDDQMKMCECGERPSQTRGYCIRCYQRKRRRGELKVLRDYDGKPRCCEVEGCEGNVLAKGMCSRHYDRQRRTVVEGGDAGVTGAEGGESSEAR